LEPYKDVLGNPVAWQKKPGVYKADIISVVESTDPNGSIEALMKLLRLPSKC